MKMRNSEPIVMMTLIVSLILVSVIDGEPTDEETVVRGVILAEGSPLEGVNVTITNGETNWTTSNFAGVYEFRNISAGNYVLTFTKYWAETVVKYVTVVEGETYSINVTMDLLNLCGLNGTITTNDGNDPTAGADVSVEIRGEYFNITANEDGYFEYGEIPTGHANITISLEGYELGRQNTILYERTCNTVNISLENLPPLEVTFDPPDGTINLSVYRYLVLNFTRSIDRSTINGASVILRDTSTGDNVTVSFDFFEDDTVVMLLMDKLLEYGTGYVVEVSTSVRDVLGYPIREMTTSHFTTEWEAVDISVVSTYPDDDEAFVPVETRIITVFPEPLVAQTIHEDTVQMRVSGGDGTIIPGTVIYDAENYTVEFIPLSDLEYGTRYSFWLGQEIEPVNSTHNFMGKILIFETEISMTTGSITGRIIDQDGFPFPPEIVVIEMTDNEHNTVGFHPNLDGNFEHFDLDEDVYDLKIMIEGEVEYTTLVTITAGQATDLGTIELDNDIGPEVESKTVVTLGGIIVMVAGITCLILMLFIVGIIIIIKAVTKKKVPEE